MVTGESSPGDQYRGQRRLSVDGRKVARQEAVKREVNEAIEDGLWPDEQQDTVRMRCECGSADCIAFVRISIADYERVRQHPRRFVIAHGHQVATAEKVIADTSRYAVVEKVGEAGAIAERSDPRRGDVDEPTVS
jgi:hypothetical protein